MLANSLGFVVLTVAWTDLAGNADHIDEFLPQLDVALKRPSSKRTVASSIIGCPRAVDLSWSISVAAW